MALTRDELAERFEVLAKYDPGMGINLCRIGANTVATLAAGPAHPESTRRFWDLAVDAVALFDPGGTGDENERWLSMVRGNAPNLIARDALGGVIRNAAYASALVVRRLGNSAEANHQPKAPAKQNPDEAPRPDGIDVVGLLAGVQTPTLPPSRPKAYESFKRALEEKPELKGEPLKRVWLWLQENDPHPDYKLPRFGTWTSYIREYRRAQRGVVATPRAGRPHGPSVARRDQL